MDNKIVAFFFLSSLNSTAAATLSANYWGLSLVFLPVFTALGNILVILSVTQVRVIRPFGQGSFQINIFLKEILQIEGSLTLHVLITVLSLGSW